MSELNRADTILVVQALRHFQRDVGQDVAGHLSDELGENQDATEVASRIDGLCERIAGGGAYPAALSMKAMIPRLPSSLTYCFSPGYAPADRPQDIVLVFGDGGSGFVPTALCAPNLAAAEALCALLNAPLGLDEQQRLCMTARSMNPGAAAGRAEVH